MKLLNYTSHCTIYCAYNHIKWLTKFPYHDLNIVRKTMKWVNNNSWTTTWHFFLRHFVTRLSIFCNVMRGHIQVECEVYMAEMHRITFKKYGEFTILVFLLFSTFVDYIVVSWLSFVIFDRSVPHTLKLIFEVHFSDFVNLCGYKRPIITSISD